MSYQIKIRDAELAADARAVAGITESGAPDRAAAEAVAASLRAKYGTKVVVSIDEASQTVTAKRLLVD